MKKLTAIPLALLILALAMKDLVVWTSFKLNQDFIAKTLCINRGMPEKKCNGKCQLTKNLASSKEKTPSKAPVPQPDELNQVLDIHPITNFAIVPPNGEAPKRIPEEHNFALQYCLSDFFQPPRSTAFPFLV